MKYFGQNYKWKARSLLYWKIDFSSFINQSGNLNIDQNNIFNLILLASISFVWPV